MSELAQQARAARRAGRLPEAIALYEQVLVREPNQAHIRHELGSLLAQTGNLDAALPHLREARRLNSGSPEILNNLGGVLEQLDNVDEAITCYREAAVLSSHDAIPFFNAGDLLRRTGRDDDALPMLRAAATLDPNLQEAWSSLGQLHLARNEPAAAIGPLRRAKELRPSDAAAAACLGDALQSLRKFAESIAAYEQAVQRDAGSLQAWYGMGRALLEQGRAAEAVAAFERCLAIDAADMRATHDLGKALFQLGCVERAVERLRHAAKTGPEEVRRNALENLAIIVPGSPNDDNRSILQTRQAWATLLPSRPAPRSFKARAEGRFRIGYVSSFFHRPNWMKPVWALINHHNREQFEIHLFSDAPLHAVHGGYRRHPNDQFHDMTGQTNEAVADRIADMGIDLLIDLNAYSAPERLGIYPLRPAPILASWFNSYASTGLEGIDYLIGDESVLPPQEEIHYPERILRVPHSYLTFEVDYPVPDVAPLPMLQTGVLTIGCLASQYKLTDQVIAVWSDILRRCPKARLLIRNGTLGNAPNQEHLQRRFAACGIESHRLALEGPAEHAEFLKTYDRIDFALDPFPYSGGTTTMEALWQGVPVVTFDGGRWASRTSISLLRAAGLDEFVGKNVDYYVAICVRLATSPDSPKMLSEFRANIRARLRQSPVCDAAGFAKAMEAICGRMLQEGFVD
jgi:protein O-GlcNAc transferase